jgi:hypothetical protein
MKPAKFLVSALEHQEGVDAEREIYSQSRNYEIHIVLGDALQERGRRLLI